MPWRDLALPLPGGTLCANEPDFPEWKSGIQILHRGQAADKVPLREAYIAMFVAAGWTQVTRDESDPMKHVGTILHLHLQRADGTQALVGSIFASADRVHVDLQRLGWDDQRRNRQLEANKIVEDALEHAPARP